MMPKLPYHAKYSWARPTMSGTDHPDPEWFALAGLTKDEVDASGTNSTAGSPAAV